MKTLSSSPRIKLFTLAGLHGYVDLIGGLLPGILPALLQHFNISLGAAAVLICCIGISSNLLQMPLATLTRNRTNPSWILVGLAACSLTTLLRFLPSATPFWLLCLLLLVVGAGIGMVHPLGLRGIAGLNGIHPMTATPFFMLGGFTGFATAPFIGAVLVARFGFAGLLWLLLPAALLAIAIPLVGLTLADGHTANRQTLPPDPRRWRFQRLFILSIFLNTGTLTTQSLLPTRLTELDFSLSYGGFCAMLFGLGSASGSMLAGYLAKRCNSSTLIIAGLAIGTPLTLLGLSMPGMAFLPVLLFLAGMTAASGFPLIVAMTGTLPADGADLGTRLAWLVGGTWGIAGLLFLLIGQLADWYGSGVLLLAAAFYAAALATALAKPVRLPGRTAVSR